MQPTAGDVHVNAPLTNISIAYMQSADAFIASRVFPNVPVMKQSDRYYTYDRGAFNRDEMKPRAPGTESNGGGYTLDNTPTYFCNTYGFHKDIPDAVRANADSMLNIERDASEYVALKALLLKEKAFVSNFFTTGKWTTDVTGVSSGPTGAQFLQWNDANADPIIDVRKGKRTVRQLTGFEPNKLTLGRATYDALLDHPDIIDRIKYGQTQGGPAKASSQLLAQLFEVDEVLVMNAIENTAAEGATASHSFIGGKAALLTFTPPTPGLMTPAAGYTFSWTGLMGAGALGGRIRMFRIETLQSDRVEIDLSFDMKLVGPDLGYFFASAVA